MSQTLAPSKVTARDPKGLKFISIVEDAYNKAGLTEEESQRVNEAPGLADLVGGFIAKHRSQDPRFKLIKTLDIVVPDDYVHATCLATFGEAHRSKFYFYDDNLTDQNFSRATVQLKPGQ
ncbi:MAG: hypothetical protein AAB722_00315, partial [Patescibacteria group bacterium]